MTPTVKEQLVNLLMDDAGLDFLTACEEASHCISTVLQRGRPVTFTIGTITFTLDVRP